MSRQGTIKRYSLILEKTSKKHYPSFERIKDYLFDHGFEISSRTIQRDIEQIRNEFGISILYHRDKNGYYVEEDSSINFDRFLRFLGLMNTADLLADTLRDSQEGLYYIHFESSDNLKGIEHLKPLLEAIKSKRKIEFIHENYQKNTTRPYEVHPYLLKEYLSRWYLLAFVPQYEEMRIFGIDRISNLKLKKSVFKQSIDDDLASFFKDTIGVSYFVSQKEKVVLSFDPLEAKYIKSLPMHSSQEIIQETEKELIVRLDIIPNMEFYQRILMMGYSVVVLEPLWLAEKIRSTLQKALGNYEKA